MSLIIGVMLSVCSLVSNGAPVCKPAPVAPLHDPRGAARQQVGRLVAGIQHIERIRAKAPGDAVDRNCVDRKLAEARVGLQIATDEIARLDASVGNGDAGEQDYSMRRLRLLAERANDLTKAAQVCITEEVSSIDVTQVQVFAPKAQVPDPTFQRPY
ncbi:MAG: hypothetical protein ABUS79_22635 [Pseudomonadota bacterium]